MVLPFFYVHDLSNTSIALDEDASKHMIGVLRMEKGEELLLTDGKGKKAQATIVDDHRKKCVVSISSVQTEEQNRNKVAIGISLIKNATRFEWFLEKATEIGIQEVIPLVCTRTEKEKFRFDRMQSILISAMLQSQQCWLPLLHEPTNFEKLMTTTYINKYIAHCLPEQRTSLRDVTKSNESSLILIGPEGDFTPEEIRQALANNFTPVMLGNTRLRTETAGVVAATLLSIK
jgi:16S rRNA (uracil1498-N3)-methyltransferase